MDFSDRRVEQASRLSRRASCPVPLPRQLPFPVFKDQKLSPAKRKQPLQAFENQALKTMGRA